MIFLLCYFVTSFAVISGSESGCHPDNGIHHHLTTSANVTVQMDQPQPRAITFPKLCEETHVLLGQNTHGIMLVINLSVYGGQPDYGSSAGGDQDFSGTFGAGRPMLTPIYGCGTTRYPWPGCQGATDRLDIVDFMDASAINCSICVQERARSSTARSAQSWIFVHRTDTGYLKLIRSVLFQRSTTPRFRNSFTVTASLVHSTPSQPADNRYVGGTSNAGAVCKFRCEFNTTNAPQPSCLYDDKLICNGLPDCPNGADEAVLCDTTSSLRATESGLVEDHHNPRTASHSQLASNLNGRRKSHQDRIDPSNGSQSLSSGLDSKEANHNGSIIHFSPLGIKTVISIAVVAAVVGVILVALLWWMFCPKQQQSNSFLTTHTRRCIETGDTTSLPAATSANGNCYCCCPYSNWEGKCRRTSSSSMSQGTLQQFSAGGAGGHRDRGAVSSASCSSTLPLVADRSAHQHQHHANNNHHGSSSGNRHKSDGGKLRHPLVGSVEVEAGGFSCSRLYGRESSQVDSLDCSAEAPVAVVDRRPQRSCSMPASSVAADAPSQPQPPKHRHPRHSATESTSTGPSQSRPAHCYQQHTVMNFSSRHQNNGSTWPGLCTNSAVLAALQLEAREVAVKRDFLLGLPYSVPRPRCHSNVVANAAVVASPTARTGLLPPPNLNPFAAVSSSVLN